MTAPLLQQEARRQKSTRSTQSELSARLEGLEESLPIEEGRTADGLLVSRENFGH